MLQELFYKIFMLSLSGTIIFFIITLLRPMTDRVFSPTWRYYLLIVTLVTFIIPYGLIMPKLQNPLTNIVKTMEVKDLKAREVEGKNVVESNEEMDYIAKPKEKTQDFNVVESLTREIMNENNHIGILSVREVLGVVWFLGSIAFLINGFLRIFRFNRELKSASKGIESEDIKEVFYKCCQELKIKKKIGIKLCDKVGTPMVTGIIKPEIILPREDMNLDFLEMVFNHELMHYKHRDLWIKIASFTIRSIHWFNPIVYLVNKELNKACELNCDWKVIKDMNRQEKNCYGLAILDTINHSLDNKGVLSTAMADSSKKELKRRLTMIKVGKKPRKLITILSIITATVVTLTSVSMANAFGKNIKGNKSIAAMIKTNKSIAVMIKENKLLSVDLETGSEAIIDNGNTLNRPVISPDGKHVAYTKEGVLYIGNTSLDLRDKVIECAKDVVSYGWKDSEEIAYSTQEGGLNGYNLSNKKYSSYIKSEYKYENITSDHKENLYAEVYRYYTKDGGQYIENKGILNLNTRTLKDKMIIPSVPMNEEGTEMGLKPKIAGISKDGEYLYIWRKTSAGSLNSDGVPFGTYEVKSGEFIPCKDENVFALAYKDNLAINPLDGKSPVINNGGIRDMNINKTLGKVDVTSCEFTNILPKNMIATEGPYEPAASGMSTMTPSFSLDGKMVVFSGAEATENVEQWNKEPHNIYRVNPNTKKLEKLTKNNTFDFAPSYISEGGDLVFLRKTAEDKASLWKLQGDTEKLMVDGINLHKDDFYYGHYNTENILDIYVE